MSDRNAEFTSEDRIRAIIESECYSITDIHFMNTSLLINFCLNPVNVRIRYLDRCESNVFSRSIVIDYDTPHFDQMLTELFCMNSDEATAYLNALSATL